MNRKIKLIRKKPLLARLREAQTVVNYQDIFIHYIYHPDDVCECCEEKPIAYEGELNDIRKEKSNHFFYLKFQMIRDGCRYINHYQLDSITESRNITYQLLLQFLCQSVKEFKLYDKVEREKYNWCLDFDEIFIYNQEDRLRSTSDRKDSTSELKLKNPEYSLLDLCELSHTQFLNRQLGYQISEITIRNNKIARINYI